MTTNYIGTCIFIATATPATNDDTGFEALTWVEVKGLQSAGALGITHAKIDRPDLCKGFTTQTKGAASGTDSNLVFYDVDGDAGQTGLKDLAEGSEGVGSVKLVQGSGALIAPVAGDPVLYAQGVFSDYVRRERTVDTDPGFTTMFRNNAIPVDAVEPV